MSDPGSQQTLTAFLSKLNRDQGLIARYRTPEGFEDILAESQLPENLKKILRDNDEKAAQEVMSQEGGAREGAAAIPFIIH